MTITIDFGNFWEMLSALGTVGAVIVSLWLASRTEKTNLYLHSCIGYSQESGAVKYIFEIINVGKVPTRLIYEEISRFNWNLFNPETEFDGVLDWTFNEKNLAASYASVLRPNESIILEVESEVMRQTIRNLIGEKKLNKLYFFIVDSTNRRHFTEISVEDIMEEI